MTNVDVTFSVVSIPANTSGTIYVYEDVGDDGGASQVTVGGTTINYDNTDSAALVDADTDYTLSGFDASSGNRIWARVEIDNTDDVTTAELTEALTIETTAQSIAATVDTNTFQEPPTTVSPGPVSVAGTLDTLTFAEPSTTVTPGPVSVAGTLDALTFAEPPTTISAAQLIAATTDTTTFAEPPTALTGAGTVSVGGTVDTLTFAEPAAGVATLSLINATTDTLTFAEPETQIQLVDLWQLGGQALTEVTGETSTAVRLTLTSRVTTTVLENALRPLKPNEGKVDVLMTDDGGFVAVDRANENNTFTADPPERRKPLRQSGDVHVERYEEDLVSSEVGEWDVELELIRDADREDTPSISETPAADEWGFTTALGTIATARVDAEFLGTGSDGVERYELTTRLTFDQAHSFEAALAKIAGTRVKQIPDAPNIIVDETAGDDNTVTVDAPDGQTVVADGEYVVTEWESRRINDGYQEVSFTMAATF